MSLDIERILSRLAERHTQSFKYQDRVLTTSELCSPTGALPLLAKRANLLSDFLFAKPLEVSYPSDPAAMTGEKLVVSPGQHSFVLVMLLYDVIEEMVINAGQGDVVVS